MANDSSIPEEIRQQFIAKAEAELNRLVEMKPGDARIHVFFGSFYRSINNLEAATKQMDIARELSPGKPSIVAQQAVIAYSKGDTKQAEDLFEEAFRLEEDNIEARGHYAAILLVNGKAEEAKALAEDERIINKFAENQFLLNSAKNAGETDFLITLYETRVKTEPQEVQNWVSLSYLYLQEGEQGKSIDTLERSIEANPGFAKTATCFADNIKAGKEPAEGCQ